MGSSGSRDARAASGFEPLGNGGGQRHNGMDGKDHSPGEYDKVLAGKIMCYMCCCQCACCRKGERGALDGPAVVKNALVIGLPGAGKTTLVERLCRLEAEKDRPFASRIEDAGPTQGFNIREVPHGSSMLRVWDLSGAPRIRQYWHKYLPQAHAVVFVVDGHACADPKALREAIGVLDDFLRNSLCTSFVPLLVVVSKAETPGAATTAQVEYATEEVLGDRLPRRFAVRPVAAMPQGESDASAGEERRAQAAAALSWLFAATS